MRFSTFSALRWTGLFGQAVALLVAAYFLDLVFDFVAAMALVLIAGAITAVFAIYSAGQQRLPNHVTTAFLLFDVLELSALLWLTGGIINPFALLLIVPLAIAGAYLDRLALLIVVGLALVCASVLAVWHQPLAWPASEAFSVPDLYVTGLWAALVLALAFLALIFHALGRDAGRLRQAIDAGEVALAEERRAAGMSALAAATAHELGGPLSTIAVIAKDLARDLPAESPLQDDARLLRQETERAAGLLAQMARDPKADDGPAVRDLPFASLLEELVPANAHLEIKIDAHLAGIPVRRRPELTRALALVIDNAHDFAKHQLHFEARLGADTLTLFIMDDGPGFPPMSLAALGEPYRGFRPLSSDGQSNGDHLGLGLFLLRRLMAAAAGRVVFSNRPEGGACVALTWPRPYLRGLDD